jgi:hypothetical protein
VAKKEKQEDVVGIAGSRVGFFIVIVEKTPTACHGDEAARMKMKSSETTLLQQSLP